MRTSRRPAWFVFNRVGVHQEHSAAQPQQGSSSCGHRRSWNSHWEIRLFKSRGGRRGNAVASCLEQPYNIVVRGALIALLLLCVCISICDSEPATEFFSERKKMVEEQLAAPGRDIKNQRVLEAMSEVPRHEFVPKVLGKFAYLDEPLPIGYGQTISQPFIVAFMTEQLDPKPTDRVLEIGTGSGYQAAVLSRLVREVYTIEIIEPLARRAEADLKRLGYNNVKVLAGDGYKGWPDQAPFDAIIVTCAPDHIPQPLVEQLRDGGRMIIPVGALEDQQLFLLQKHGIKVEQQAVLPVRFVPMKRG
jgi:protein-L-isoaspartate(D-aspartate) O-methyltransferase